MHEYRLSKDLPYQDIEGLEVLFRRGKKISLSVEFFKGSLQSIYNFGT